MENTFLLTGLHPTHLQTTDEDKLTATQHQQDGQCLVFHCRRQHQLPTTALGVGPDLVSSSPWVRDLGIFIDADLSVCAQVQRTVVSCSTTLRQFCSIGRSVPGSVYQSLVVALVLSRLDYGNITLISIPVYQLHRLQSVMNAAARPIAGLRRSDHITDTLISLHWLRSSERIQYKLVTTVTA